MMTEIRVGHTPDSDDAFMFYAIENGLIPTGEFKIVHVIEDIEKLNKRAINHELEVTAISAHAYAFLSNYVILNSGGSFGINYGPIILSKNKSIEKIREGTVGIPGLMTSAYLLMSIALGKVNYKEMVFNEIPDAVSRGDVDFGLVIHESQITYPSFKLNKVFDLGKWWHENTGGLPVPLGINVASSALLTSKQILEVDKILQNSIKYSLDHIDEAVDFSSKYGRGTSKITLTEFIKMYVNNVTLDMKSDGKRSISKLFELANTKGLLNKEIELKYSS